MDFFDAQERARKLSGWLVLLFVLAVVVIILVVYAVLAVFLIPGDSLWDLTLFLSTAAALGLVVAGASAARSAGLRSGGGASVAEFLGGRELSPSTTDPRERRLLNVVEEMALSAGTPVPAVYLLDDEQAINAFAAGYSPEDAVVGFTRGALDTFSRDELQAVAAHEFSHIVNRDIRLNIRLTGLLFGILALGLGGRMLLRASFYGGTGRRDGRAAAAILAGGLALFITGYIGVLLGRIIRAGVSRQREYLADAAAVQWTRNPDGMAGALKKIGAVGSRLQTSSAEEVSHFFFANGLRSGFLSGIWSTHPPLVERVRRVEPQFDGDFSKVRLDAEPEFDEIPGRNDSPADRKSPLPGLPPLAAMVALGGTVDASEKERAISRLADVPESLHRAAHEPFGAVALVYALLLDRDLPARGPQLEVLESRLVPQLRQEVMRLSPDVDRIPSDSRLLLVDMAAPALRQLSDSQAGKLIEVLDEMAGADRRLSVFEFALKTAVRHRLAATHGGAAKPPVTSFRKVEHEARLVLAALAHVGSNNPDGARGAYSAGAAVLGLDEEATKLPACTSTDVRTSLDTLADTSVEIRSKVIAACVETALHDRDLQPGERYLIRAISAALDVPLPEELESWFGAKTQPESALG